MQFTKVSFDRPMSGVTSQLIFISHSRLTLRRLLLSFSNILSVLEKLELLIHYTLVPGLEHSSQGVTLNV